MGSWSRETARAPSGAIRVGRKTAPYDHTGHVRERYAESRMSGKELLARPNGAHLNKRRG
jgi:hypothetical protein